MLEYWSLDKIQHIINKVIPIEYGTGNAKNDGMTIATGGIGITTSDDELTHEL